MRCSHEAQLYNWNSFITLTYDDEHLPLNGSLVVKDWQLFAKRLRKRMGKFRYFACGEYGERSGRPHYHALLFGMDFHQDRQVWRRKRNYVLWRSAILEEVWPFGQSLIGDLTYETCEYVSRYVMKKRTGKGASEFYEYIRPDTGEVCTLKPPFVCMSRRPGLGADWLKKFKSDVYPRDVVHLSGRTFRPPRFYDKQLLEDELEIYKEKRRRKAARWSSEQTPDRLTTREKVAELNLARTARE